MGEVVARRRGLWRKAYRFPEVCDSFLSPPEGQERAGQIVVRIGSLRIDFDGAIEALQCMFNMVGSSER